MRKGMLSIAAFLLAACTGAAQAHAVCACGKNAPGVPQDRVVEPYANEPVDLQPFAKFRKPYYEYYTHPNIYTGAGRTIPDPKNLTEVRIGFFAPLEDSPNDLFGQRMLHGAQLAIEEANARGGYGGKPFKLMLHNDYNNWQAGAAYGTERPTDPGIWGSAGDVAVKMIYDDHDWAIFGSINSESTHIMLRVALKAEIPIVNSASTDPTIPETYVPWYFTDLQDDRVQGYTLARHIYTELGLKRIALLRVNNRYGRMGVGKFRDASVRLGHPVVIEQKFMPPDTDFSRELRIIRDSRVDGIVLWADEIQAANILKQMRAVGMKQRVFGAYRTLGPDLLAVAGPAAEGFQAVFPYNAASTNPRWLDFNRRFEARFHQPPEQFAALAYDAMNMLLDSICRAGLNRARIHDALADIEQYDGVTGPMVFDPNQKNVAPMYIGTVHNGTITYRIATMNKTQPQPLAQSMQSAPKAPLAPPQVERVGEDGVYYNGPQQPDVPAGLVRVVLFGPRADEVARSPQMMAALGAAKSRGWQLLPVPSDQNWGAAFTQLVNTLRSAHTLAIVALDRDSSHLAVQLALKDFVPVVALTNDKTLTSANIPWIFRLPPATAPAAVLRLLETATDRSGAGGRANPERLRDLLASGIRIDGFAFQPTGEPRPDN